MDLGTQLYAALRKEVRRYDPHGPGGCLRPVWYGRLVTSPAPRLLALATAELLLTSCDPSPSCESVFDKASACPDLMPVEDRVPQCEERLADYRDEPPCDDAESASCIDDCEAAFTAFSNCREAYCTNPSADGC